MAYKIYISTSDSDESIRYLAAVKRALFGINEFPVAAIDVLDNAPGTPRRLEEAKRLIDQSDIFIGLYDKSYGTVPPGDTQSFAEQEYHYAVSRNIACLIFVSQQARNTADERQAMFLAHVLEHHVVNYFDGEADLAAKVALNIAKYKVTQRMQLPPILRPGAGMSLRAETAEATAAGETEAAPAQSDDFETMVNRAVGIAQDDMEQIVRRALELHQAQMQVQQRESLTGLYVEDERDGLVLARPIWGEPVRRSQFQSDIFMIMPFRERFDAVYTNIIRPVVSGLNLTIKRGDDFSSTRGSIIQEVWAAIYACKLVIAETTEVNANVYYELGIAHTLGKPAVLLTQTAQIDQLPFDIRHMRFLVYEDSAPGHEKLETDLRKSMVWILNDLKEQAQKEDTP